MKRSLDEDSPPYIRLPPPSKRPRLEPEVEDSRPTSGFNVSSAFLRFACTNMVQPVNRASNQPRPPLQSHVTQVPQPPVIPSKAMSRPLESRSFQSAPQPAQPSSDQPASHEMLYPSSDNSLDVNREAPGLPDSMVMEQLSTESRVTSPQEFRQEANPSIDIASEALRRFAGHEPSSEARRSLPPLPECVRVPQMHLVSSSSSSEVHAPKSAVSTTLTSNMSLASSLPQAIEDSKDMIYRLFQKVSSEIESMKATNAWHSTNISNHTQELERLASERSEMERNKQDEITRTMQEIESRYEDRFKTLDQKADWLQRAKETESMELAKKTKDLSKMEEGLGPAQMLVEWCENAREDA